MSLVAVDARGAQHLDVAAHDRDPIVRAARRYLAESLVTVTAATSSRSAGRRQPRDLTRDHVEIRDHLFSGDVRAEAVPRAPTRRWFRKRQRETLIFVHRCTHLKK
jgi:hypothetical protein